MVPPRVRLVVLNYNGGALLERCVQHLERLDWPDDRLEIVVVDNCSVDGSDDVVERRHPRVRVLRNSRNTGFPANNLALGDLDAVEYVGLINNDAFVEPDMLAPLVSALEADPTVGAACPRIVLAPRFVGLRVRAPTWTAPGDGRDLSVRVDRLRLGDQDVWDDAVFGTGCYDAERGPDGAFHWLSGTSTVHLPAPGSGTATSSLRLFSPRAVRVHLQVAQATIVADLDAGETWIELPIGSQSAYDIVNNVGSILVQGGYGGDRGFLEPDLGQFDEPVEVFAWCGAGVLFRPDYLRDAGTFDERFFMYYEDTDLAWRGRARGWSYRYVPEARMRHVHAATSVEGSPMFRFWVERNRLFMLTKNAPARMAQRAIVEVAASTVSSLVRDGLRPALRGRPPSFGQVRTHVKALSSYGSALVPMLRARRRLRRRQIVPDDAILAWAVSR